MTPSKRSRKAGTSQRSGSGVNNKYVKGDLPSGSTDDNAWRRLFVSALAHFAAGYDDPWFISSDKFTLALQTIWNVVYQGKIEHVISANEPVYHIVCFLLDRFQVTNVHFTTATRLNKALTTGAEASLQLRLVFLPHSSQTLLSSTILHVAPSSQLPCSRGTGFSLLRTKATTTR